MTMAKVYLKKYPDGDRLQLFRGTPGSAGCDVPYFGEEVLRIVPQVLMKVPLLFTVEGAEQNIIAEVCGRSGMLVKFGLQVLNTIYSVEPEAKQLYAWVINRSESEDVVVNPNDRFCQVVFYRATKPRPIIVPYTRYEYSLRSKTQTSNDGINEGPGSLPDQSAGRRNGQSGGKRPAE